MREHGLGNLALKRNIEDGQKETSRNLAYEPVSMVGRMRLGRIIKRQTLLRFTKL